MYQSRSISFALKVLHSSFMHILLCLKLYFIVYRKYLRLLILNAHASQLRTSFDDIEAIFLDKILNKPCAECCYYVFNMT